MYVMAQTLKGGDGPHLPHRLSVMNTYTELTAGSKWVAVVVKNLTATLIALAKGIKVTQAVPVNVVPLAKVALGTLEQLDEIQSIQQTRMSVEQRKEMLFQQLDLSGLDGWSSKNQVAAHVLLLKFHNIFSLELGELGCTDLIKHETEVTDYEPFRERFQRIPPSMLDEVHAHVKEILEGGTIHPNQSPWFNAIMLECKKDGGLQFCINFHKLNARTKKDSYLLPWIQEATERLVSAEHFSCLDLKAGFWQMAMD